MFSDFNTSLFEILILVTGLTYLVLIIKEIRFAWVLAFCSAIGMGTMAFHKNLYMEFILQMYYVVMAVVGWLSWGKQAGQDKAIRIWSWQKHFILVALSLMVSFALAYVLEYYTDQHFALLDCVTTVFSLSVTFMVTQKILENWLYWVVINGLNVVLMYKSGLNWMALLMVLYTFMAIQGYFTWKRKFRAQDETI